MNRDANVETADSAYKNLYKLGGAAAFIAAMLILGEVILLVIFPQPDSIGGWFALFQSNRIIGLLDFWGLEVLMYAMFIPMFLALYAGLRKIHEGRMAVAITLALLGIGIFLATNNPFSMLSLSGRYAAAATDAERSTFLAAGQAILANTNQRAVGGFNLGLFLVSVAGLIISSVMLQCKSFGKLTASMGILANALSLADYLREALTQSEIAALLIILPYSLCLILWLIRTGRALYPLGRLEGMTLSKQTKRK
jgi:hypothetical protein